MITIFISYYYCGVETLYLQKCTFSGNEKKKQQHFFLQIMKHTLLPKLIL